MSPLRVLMSILLGTTAAWAWQDAAVAADLGPGVIVQQPDGTLPAVSSVNGKWEFDPGIVSGSGAIRAAGSISAPLGDRLGLQGDALGEWSGKGLVYGGALHAFTRNPSSYLAGVTAGFVNAPGATIGAVGLEGELYVDRISLQGWAGVAGINYVDPAILDKSGAFAIGDIGLYVSPDWKFELGGSYVVGDLAVHAGTEYLFHDLGAPLALTGDARLHADGNYALTIGLKGYFGGSDAGKTLVDRQRQDDPENAALDLFGAAGDELFQTAPAVQEQIEDTESWCVAHHQSTPSWHWDGTFCHFVT